MKVFKENKYNWERCCEDQGEATREREGLSTPGGRGTRVAATVKGRSSGVTPLLGVRDQQTQEEGQGTQAEAAQ